jgi:hypothetical protein
VHASAEAQGSTDSFADGSRFRTRCESLGRGPVADDFGTVSTATLFVWFDERIAAPDLP